jgi:hypothetical protein
MTVSDTMGNPVKELVEQVWFFMAGSYPVGDLSTDEIYCMVELGRIIHISDVTGPECSAVNNTQETGEVGIVVKPFLWNIRIEAGGYVFYHQGVIWRNLAEETKISMKLSFDILLQNVLFGNQRAGWTVSAFERIS